jgi:hypothetical protein
VGSASVSTNQAGNAVTVSVSPSVNPGIGGTFAGTGQSAALLISSRKVIEQGTPIVNAVCQKAQDVSANIVAGTYVDPATASQVQHNKDVNNGEVPIYQPSFGNDLPDPLTGD